MYIRCQSCGQLLYIPDNSNGITVRCPACLTEFVYIAEDASAAEEENSEEQASSPDEEVTPAEEPLPEFATRESYHQPRNLKLEPFFSWDALFTAYRLFSEHFGVLILFALLTVVPGFVSNWAIHALVPELTDIQRTIAEKETFDEVLQAYQEFSQTIQPTTAMTIFGISLISFTLSVFLQIGGIRLFNAYGRKQKASFWLTLSGFDSPGRVLLTCILFFILAAAASSAGMFILFAMAMAGLSPLGIMLFIFLILFLMVYLFFVMPLIADSNLSATKAFQLSYLIAKGNIASLFGSIALLFLMMMFISAFVSTIFGSILTNGGVGLISQALF
ncbi:MAG: hypothetical protein IKS45_01965, partial [Thermoguttaceae bacterium]|nr:hypothetical protein [Thermoguttaceae bacterium]